MRYAFTTICDWFIKTTNPNYITVTQPQSNTETKSLLTPTQTYPDTNLSPKAPNPISFQLQQPLTLYPQRPNHIPYNNLEVLTLT